MDAGLVFEFLKGLSQNNNKAWFEAHREQYQKARGEFETLVDSLIPMARTIDADIGALTVKECVFRIFRDARFAKDKSPYKSNFGAYIVKGGRKSPFAGFYIHLEPGKSFVGGGVYMPEAKELLGIRRAIFERVDAFKKIIGDSEFKKHFPELFGEKLKNPPRDFPKDFADIELLKHKHFAVAHSVEDAFWGDEHLLASLHRLFMVQYPFNRFLNKAIQRVREER